MANTKRVFTAFAIEDQKLRVMLVGQRLHTDTPFEWTDMSVKEPWSAEWKTKCRSRIKRLRWRHRYNHAEHAEGGRTALGTQVRL